MPDRDSCCYEFVLGESGYAQDYIQVSVRPFPLYKAIISAIAMLDIESVLHEELKVDRSCPAA